MEYVSLAISYGQKLLAASYNASQTVLLVVKCLPSTYIRLLTDDQKCSIPFKSGERGGPSIILPPKIGRDVNHSFE